MAGDYDQGEVLAGLTECGQLALAERWAAGLEHSMQVVLVQHCVNSGRLREAVHLVKHFQLLQVSGLSQGMKETLVLMGNVIKAESSAVQMFSGYRAVSN